MKRQPAMRYVIATARASSMLDDNDYDDENDNEYDNDNDDQTHIHINSHY